MTTVEEFFGPRRLMFKGDHTGCHQVRRVTMLGAHANYLRRVTMLSAHANYLRRVTMLGAHANYLRPLTHPGANRTTDRLQL